MRPKPQYMVADVTEFQSPSLLHPFYPMVPFFMGMGPETPRDTFVHDGKEYRVHRVFWATHNLNPYSVPVVMAQRMKR